MSSSRISILWMNTRSSRSEQIFAPLVGPLESCDEVVVPDVLEKLLTNAQLNILGGFEALLFERLNIGRNENAADVAGGCEAWPVDPPLRDDSIRIQP